MAKKNILKKIAGIVLAVAVCSSVCIMPQATNELLPNGAQKTLVCEFDFDTSTMTYGADVDGVKVSGGAFSAASGLGKSGNGLKASISDTYNYRSLAFNDPVNNKWLTLNAGSYYATYDYKVTAVKDTTTTATPILKFIKILKRDSGFWSNSANSGYQKSVSNDLIGDYDHLSTDWQQGGVYFDIDADNSWFGLIAYTLKAAVILDNIKIYRIDGYNQPAVYDFDSHNFHDGIKQTSAANTVDGLDGTTRNDQIAFLTVNSNLTGNGGFYNVVNVENGSSRSYYVDSTAVKYNNETDYPGLAGSGHNNVLRFGWDFDSNKPDKMDPRNVALNNGSEALTLDPGTYMVSFDYYVAGEAADVKMDVVYNFTNNINSSGFYVLGESAANIYNVFSGSPTKNQWISASVEVTVDAATNGFGFRFSSGAGTTRGTEVFLDNIKIEVPVEPEDPGENTWNFDYGVNSATPIKSGGVYAVDACPVEAEGTDGKVLNIAFTTAYNGDGRAAALYTSGTFKALTPGMYRVTFDYLFTNLKTSNTITTTNGYIGFGTLKESFSTTTAGQLHNAGKLSYSSLTTDKASNVWHKGATVTFNVTQSDIDEGYAYFGIEASGLGKAFCLDNISIEELVDPGENTWNFDYGVNAVKDSSGKLMNSGSVYVVGGYDAEGTDGNVLKIAVANELYNGQDRAVALYSNGTYKLLNKGVYKVKFDYLYTDLITTNGYDKTKGYIGFGTVKNTETFVGTSTDQLNVTGKLVESTSLVTSETEKDKWYSAECKFTVSEDGLAFGIMCAGLGKAYCLDNITIVSIDSDNEYHFDYGVNAGKEFYANHQYIYAIKEDEDGNKYMTIAYMPDGNGGSTYGGVERGMIFGTPDAENNKIAKHLDKGVYAISFRYSFATIPNKTFKNGYISFGGAKDTENFNTTATGQVNQLATVKDTTLTSGKQEDTWYTYKLLMFVDDEAGIDFALTCENLNHSYKLDDIVIKNVTAADLNIAGDSFAVDGEYIIMDGACTTVSELKESAENGESFVITRGTEALSDDVFIATGDKVVLLVNNIDASNQSYKYDTKTVVVLYDVNGDGEVDVRDLVNIYKIKDTTPANQALIEKAIGGELTNGDNLVRTALLNTVNSNVTINNSAVSGISTP